MPCYICYPNKVLTYSCYSWMLSRIKVPRISGRMSKKRARFIVFSWNFVSSKNNFYRKRFSIKMKTTWQENSMLQITQVEEERAEWREPFFRFALFYFIYLIFCLFASICFSNKNETIFLFFFCSFSNIKKW